MLLLQAVERHVQSLQLWLYQALTELRHSNEQPLVKLFGQHHLRNVSVQSCIFQASLGEMQLIVAAHTAGINVCRLQPAQLGSSCCALHPSRGCWQAHSKVTLQRICDIQRLVITARCTPFVCSSWC